MNTINVSTLLVLTSALTVAACGGGFDAKPPANDTAPQATSCEAAESTDAQGNVLWHFNAPLSSNPVPGDCEEMDAAQGYYLCKPAACLALPYTGSCPHCPGGGE